MNKPKTELVRNVAALYIGILLLSGALSLTLHFDFGVNLFFLGVLVGGVEAFLGGSPSSNKRNPSTPTDRYGDRPYEELSDQISYKAAHTLPLDAFENVMMFAGLAALISSLPFMAAIVFGK